MTDLEPVERGTLLPRGTRPVVLPDRPAAGRSRSRTLVAAGIRALARGPLLPVSALTVTAVAAARVAGMAARMARESGAAVVGRIPSAPVRGTTLEVSWTHVEVRWRG